MIIAIEPILAQGVKPTAVGTHPIRPWLTRNDVNGSPILVGFASHENIRGVHRLMRSDKIAANAAGIAKNAKIVKAAASAPTRPPGLVSPAPLAITPARAAESAVA